MKLLQRVNKKHFLLFCGGLLMSLAVASCGDLIYQESIPGIPLAVQSLVSSSITSSSSATMPVVWSSASSSSSSGPSVDPRIVDLEARVGELEVRIVAARATEVAILARGVEGVEEAEKLAVAGKVRLKAEMLIERLKSAIACIQRMQPPTVVQATEELNSAIAEKERVDKEVEEASVGHVEGEASKVIAGRYMAGRARVESAREALGNAEETELHLELLAIEAL
jgi:hypothetical protein